MKKFISMAFATAFLATSLIACQKDDDHDDHDDHDHVAMSVTDININRV